MIDMNISIIQQRCFWKIKIILLQGFPGPSSPLMCVLICVMTFIVSRCLEDEWTWLLSNTLFSYYFHIRWMSIGWWQFCCSDSIGVINTKCHSWCSSRDIVWTSSSHQGLSLKTFSLRSLPGASGLAWWGSVVAVHSQAAPACHHQCRQF